MKKERFQTNGKPAQAVGENRENGDFRRIACGQL